MSGAGRATPEPLGEPVAAEALPPAARPLRHSPQHPATHGLGDWLGRTAGGGPPRDREPANGWEGADLLRGLRMKVFLSRGRKEKGGRRRGAVETKGAGEAGRRAQEPRQPRPSTPAPVRARSPDWCPGLSPPRPPRLGEERTRAEGPCGGGGSVWGTGSRTGSLMRTHRFSLSRRRGLGPLNRGRYSPHPQGGTGREDASPGSPLCLGLTPEPHTGPSAPTAQISGPQFSRAALNAGARRPPSPPSPLPSALSSSSPVAPGLHTQNPGSSLGFDPGSDTPKSCVLGEALLRLRGSSSPRSQSKEPLEFLVPATPLVSLLPASPARQPHRWEPGHCSAAAAPLLSLGCSLPLEPARHGPWSAENADSAFPGCQRGRGRVPPAYLAEGHVGGKRGTGLMPETL